MAISFLRGSSLSSSMCAAFSYSTNRPHGQSSLRYPLLSEIWESNVDIVQKIIKKCSPSEHYVNIVRLLLFIHRHVTAGSSSNFSWLSVSSRELYRTRKLLPVCEISEASYWSDFQRLRGKQILLPTVYLLQGR